MFIMCIADALKNWGFILSFPVHNEKKSKIRYIFKLDIDSVKKRCYNVANEKS